MPKTHYSSSTFMQLAPRPNRFAAFLVAATFASSPVICSSAWANLVVNGGFEAGATNVSIDPTGGTAVGGGDTYWKDGSLAGWDLGPSSNSPNVIATNHNIFYASAVNGDPGAAQGGPHSGDLAAVFPNFPLYDGYISQVVTGLTVGNVYTVSFWLANQIGDNANNYMRVNWGGTIASPGDPITGGTDFTGGTPPLPGAIPVPTDWTYYSFDVTATATSQRLSFIGGNDAAGNLIDDVVVVPVPETSAIGTLTGLGLLALCAVLRIRRPIPVPVVA